MRPQLKHGISFVNGQSVGMVHVGVVHAGMRRTSTLEETKWQMAVLDLRRVGILLQFGILNLALMLVGRGLSHQMV